MRFEPPLPTTSFAAPLASTTIEGDIIDPTRTPGSKRWNPAGWRSSSPRMLLQRMPVPSMTSPEHSPFDVVIEATFPSASHTEMWVVPRSQIGRAGSASAASSTARSFSMSIEAPRKRCANSTGSTAPCDVSDGQIRWIIASSNRPPNDGAGAVSSVSAPIGTERGACSRTR